MILHSEKTPKKFTKSWLLAAIFFTILLLISSCAEKPPRKPPKPVITGFSPISKEETRELVQNLDFGQLAPQKWTDLAPSLRASLAYTRRRPAEQTAVQTPGLKTVTWQDITESLELLQKLLPRLSEEPELLEQNFNWLSLNPDTLFTGYYEPTLDASLTPDAEFQYPLYGVPENLRIVDLGKFHTRWKGQSLVYRIDNDEIAPFYSRNEIDFQNALSESEAEIAWLKNLTDIFYLQIQGSGRLSLNDGSSVHVLYAGKNGRPYRSLGKEFLRRKLMPGQAVNKQNIQNFFEQNPEQIEELLSTNPSYVFFRLHDKGPYGAIGQILTPMVSVAVDRKMIPLGSLMALQLELPQQDKSWKDPLKKLTTIALAQDTGGAITKNHIDYFFGSAPPAEGLASNLMQKGKVFLLIKKSDEELKNTPPSLALNP